MNTISIKKNTILNIIKTASSIVIPMITFPYVVRVLLPDSLGKIDFASTYVNYFALIAELGISVYAIRECAKNKNDREDFNETASQLFSINIISTLASYFLLFISFFFLTKLKNYKELIIIQSSTLMLATLGADWINSAMEDFEYTTIRNVAFQIIPAVLTFIFVKSDSDYVLYSIINVVSAAGACILNIIYRKKYCDIRFTLKIDWKKHINPIRFMFIKLVFESLYANFGTSLLGFIKTDSDVAFYSTAFKLCRIISQLVQSIIYVVLPRLSYYFSENSIEEVNVLLRKLLGFNITIGLPITIGIIMTASEIILIIAGDQYMPSIDVLRILILEFAISLIGGSFLCNAILLPTGNDKKNMINSIVYTIVYMLLNIVLIPGLSAKGVAISKVISSIVSLIILSFGIDSRIKIEKKKELILPPVVGAIIIVLLCLAFSCLSNLYVRFIVSVITSALAYFIVQILLKNDLVLDTLNDVKRMVPFLNK